MKPRVLIVEDDPRIAELVEKNLESAGFSCATERTGTGALDAFEREHPDVLVLDIMLPGVDGVEITRLAWYGETEIAELDLAPGVSVVLAQAFRDRSRAHFEPATWRPPG